MKTDDHIWSMSPDGGIQGRDIHQGFKCRYQADTPFDHSLAPYLIMVVCAAVDMAFFYGLFSTLSYDSPLMLVMQITGFLFAFDVVPLYLGITAKRLRQGISKDKLGLWAAIAVCILAVALNMTLRVAVMDRMDPGQSSPMIQTAGMVSEQGGEDAELTPLAAAQTALGICVPLLTSVGSFFISYMTYDPLKILKERREKELALKLDDLRRYRAILSEYDACGNYAAMLDEDDRAQYQSILKTHRALVFSHCRYVRQKLKEHLADPTSNNLLSQETCEQLTRRMNQELAALDILEPQQRPDICPKADLTPMSHLPLTASSGEVVA